jgi:hypothetical protein
MPPFCEGFFLIYKIPYHNLTVSQKISKATLLQNCFETISRSGFKTSDQAQEQGANR